MDRLLGRNVAVSRCTVANLCAGKWGKVSCSGATLLRLSLGLLDGTSLEVVAKVLSPDPVNLFKLDCRFDSRLGEIAWAKWWGEQAVPFAATIYDTQADVGAREFWILQEYFPIVGWPDVRAEGMKGFTNDAKRLKGLFAHAADVHAHSRKRIGELLPIFDGQGIRHGHLCRLRDLADSLRSFCQDVDFCSSIGIADDERRRIEECGNAVDRRQPWVDEWDIVCVTNDLSPENFALRGEGDSSQYVTFDWGAARLAPMELDIDLLLRRIPAVDEAVREELLSHYLEVYGRQTGHRIDPNTFSARIPWARLFFHLRLIAEHVNSLRWVPHQTRSREFIHFIIGPCERWLKECRTSV